VLRRKGKWRIDTLKYDIEACGGGEAEEDEGEEDTRPDHELFDELVALNAQLEAQGIKAFGELEAQSYQVRFLRAREVQRIQQQHHLFDRAGVLRRRRAANGTGRRCQRISQRVGWR
jgi:hypothetical protein